MARAATAEAATYTATFRGEPAQVRQARKDLAAYLADCPQADDAVLIASELCANAVTHTRSQHGSFTIHAQRFPGYLWIEVTDEGGTWQTSPSAHGDGGRGLEIVHALSGDWGTDGDDSGRTVWARIDLGSRE